MPSSSNPRIKRGPGPTGKLTDWNVREEAWPYLLEDFESRCAYTMRHLMHDADSQMEIDHFDPTLEGAARNHYSNLMLATAHCNNFKRAKWPHKALRDQGYRFLNPTLEQDYGLHIFENPETNELEGDTTEGRYHIDMLDLNNRAFVNERKVRAAYYKGRKELPWLFDGTFPQVTAVMGVFWASMKNLIPRIPAPPSKAT